MSGIQIPERVKNRAELLPGLEMYLQAFFDLSGDRHVGMSPGRIPWTSVAQYARFHEFDEEQTEFLFRIIPQLDTISLERGKHADT